MHIVRSKLRVAMAKANIKSIAELAKLTELHRTTLSSYCDAEGIANITFSNLITLCNVLKCSIDDIIELCYDDSPNINDVNAG